MSKEIGDREEARELFSELYEEMTDPIKMEKRRVKEERENKIKSQFKEYGI